MIAFAIYQIAANKTLSSGSLVNKTNIILVGMGYLVKAEGRGGSRSSHTFRQIPTNGGQLCFMLRVRLLWLVINNCKKHKVLVAWNLALETAFKKQTCLSKAQLSITKVLCLHTKPPSTIRKWVSSHNSGWFCGVITCSLTRVLKKQVPHLIALV